MDGKTVHLRHLIEEMLILIEQLQTNGRIQDGDPAWLKVQQLDSRIAEAARGQFPSIDWQSDCKRFGFCRIPYGDTLNGTYLMTDAGYLDSSRQWRQAMRILASQAQSPPEGIVEPDGSLSETDPKAKQFMDGGRWVTAEFALERFDIKGPQLTKAATKAKGLYSIQIERRKNSDGLFVYHFGSLQLLRDAIDREE